MDANGRGSGKVTLASRQGLMGEATLEGTAAPGALLQEAARAIPSDLKLRIGLDPSLGGEINSAKQVLQGINRIEAVPVPYPGEVHYLLSRITAADCKALLSHVGAKHSGDKTASQAKFSYPNASPCLRVEEGEAFGNKHLALAKSIDRSNADAPYVATASLTPLHPVHPLHHYLIR